MKRILILANNDIGLYKFRKELIQELINQGNHIYISLPYGEFIQPLVNMGCTFVDTYIDRRGINPITDFKLLLTYFKLLKNVKPDAVITYTVKPNIYGGMVSRINKIPYAMNITGLGTTFQNDGIIKKLVVFLYKMSSKKAKVIFFENEENQQVFIKNKIANQEITCKLNGAGINLDEYRLCNYPENDGKIRFLFIGRIMKEKGVDELFEVAKCIRNKYENVTFDIVGPFEDSYEHDVNKLHKQDIIKFHGFQNDVRPFIQNAHCLVLPSYHEGMANTLLEAGAMGRPLITTNIPGCKEALVDGETGYLVNVKDSDDLYRKILNFIEMDHEEKVMMGQASRKYIEHKFDKKIVVSKTIKRL